MKRFSEQFKKQATSIRLSAAEKRDLAERVTAYMEYHPLPKDMATMASSRATLASESFVLWKVDWSKFFGVAGTTMVLLCIMVPVVAERAVPGDVLYPVKVKFNEEVRSTLTLSPYEKVAWETERLERRIAEARLLASEGKLTDEIQSEVALAVKQHSDAAQKEIATLAVSDTDEAAIAGIAFSAALEVQSEVLGRDTTTGIGGESIAQAVTAARASQVVPAELPSVAKLLARIEIETTTASEYFAGLKKVATTEEAKDIERRLNDVARKVSEAQVLLVDGSVGATGNVNTLAIEAAPEVVAAEILRQALADTRKLISFMTDLDIKSNVTIEDLVPVTLTPEERLARADEMAREVVELQPEIQSMLTQVEDAAIRERVESGLESIDALLVEMRKIRTPETAAEAEQYATDAVAMARDLRLILTTAGFEVSDAEVVPASATSTSDSSTATSSDNTTGEVSTASSTTTATSTE